jgi:hypothetical protein
MTGRDLLCAIAGIDDGIVSASGKFSEVESSIKADRKRIRQRFTAIGIAAVICIAVFGAVKSMPQFFKVFLPSDTTTVQTPVVIPPASAPSQTVPTYSATTENGTETAAPIPGTTNGSEAETTTTTDPPTAPEDEVVYHLLYTYTIVSSAFSDYRLGKSVGEEMVGQHLEDAAATGVYVHADGTVQEDETLRCEIFALTGVDPEIAVCVRFIDRGKGLKTDRLYLLYHPDADLSSIEAYLSP